MKQSQRRQFLIQELLCENRASKGITIPSNGNAQRNMLRSQMNTRLPKEIGKEFLQVQDEYLKEETEGKGITNINDLLPLSDDLYLWQGDITTLQCDAIVNAANSGMTGCYCPCHGCIDNAIHTFAGIQLRNACAKLMESQGHEEETGKAKITFAFNLPCKYVIHTVGPIVFGQLTERDEAMLFSCYLSCLTLAAQNGIESIAFCCISTGEFHFPNKRAAEIAIKTVKNYKAETKSTMKVIFNVFKNEDYKIYRELLGQYNKTKA